MQLMYTLQNLFQKNEESSNLQAGMKFLHHATPIFKGPLKHATWTYDMRNECARKVQDKIVQKSFSPELYICESE